MWKPRVERCSLLAHWAAHGFLCHESLLWNTYGCSLQSFFTSCSGMWDYFVYNIQLTSVAEVMHMSL